MGGVTVGRLPALESITLTTANARSSYGVPVLVLEGQVFGPADVMPDGRPAAWYVWDWVRRFIGVSWSLDEVFLAMAEPVDDSAGDDDEDLEAGDDDEDLEAGDVPDEDQLEEWLDEGVCEALDGCMVEPDGHCPHGSPSWLLHLGLI